jgi:hypothetical protein
LNKKEIYRQIDVIRKLLDNLEDSIKQHNNNKKNDYYNNKQIINNDDSLEGEDLGKNLWG